MSSFTWRRSSSNLSAATSFCALNNQAIYVLADNRNLWLEHAGVYQSLPTDIVTFGREVPPPREQVDANVAAFQPLDANTLYVLGKDGNLWLDHSVNGKFGRLPPPHEQVDGNVATFQGLDANTVCVLGTDGALWLAHSVNGKFGELPPKREPIDVDIVAFQAVDENTVYVLDVNGSLWLDHSINGKFGKIPPPREQVDANVLSFQALDANTIYVLGTDGALWLAHSVNGKFGQLPPKREPVDRSVAAFQALDANTVYVLGPNGNLWLEHSVNGRFGQVPPPREQVDAGVVDFQALDANTVYVVGKDGNLWLEHSVSPPFNPLAERTPPPAKFGKVPPPREKVDANVSDPVPYLFQATLVPSYIILSVMYAPPGMNGGKSQSTSEYSSGSGLSTTLTTTSSSKNEIDFTPGASILDTQSIAGLGIDLSASADSGQSSETTTSSSVQVSMTTTNKITIPGPSVDGIDHDQDLFYLWLNPLLNVTINRSKAKISMAFGLNTAISRQFNLPPEASIIQYLRVDALKNPSNIEPGTKRFLDAAGLRPSDYSAILGTNPFASGSTAVDANRYTYQGSIPYEAPETATDPATPVEAWTLQKSTTNTTTNTKTVEYSSSATITAGFKALIGISFTVKSTMTFTNTTSSQTSSQSTQSDTVTIGGPAFGYKDLPDVIYYLDNIYGTFMYQIPTEPPVASGMVVDHAGKPVAKQTVTLTIGSRKFTGYTDSHGEYRFYNLPAAQGTLSVEGKTFSVAVGPGAAKPTLRLA